MSDNTTVLIVDDDPDIRLILRSTLDKEGYKVFEAGDAGTARECIEENSPDLILLDVMMEEVDTGFAFAEELAGKIPVIIISSIADSSVKVFDADKLPIRDILQKPVKPEVLTEKVRRALER